MKRRHSLLFSFAFGAGVISVLGACTTILGDFTTSANVTDSGPGSDVLTETSVGDGGTTFGIGAPLSAFVQPGKTTSLAITVQRGGNTSSITIAATGLPAGVTAAPLTIAGTDSTGNLVLTAAASAVVGTYAQASITATTTAGNAPAAPLNVTVSGPSGTVDTAYPKTPPYASGLGVISGAVVQPDDKLILFGTFHSTPGDAPTLAMRLNVDGSRDNTFQALIATNAAASPIALGIKGILQPDGKILIAWTEGAGSYLNVTRLTSTGALDGTWHDPTRATVSTTDLMYASTTPELLAFGLAADGSVIYAQQAASSTIDIWRWTSAGVPDSTIGTLGDYGRTQIGITSPVLAADDLGSVIPQPDGTVYFIGDGVYGSGFSSQVFARTSKSLTLDPGFGPLADAGLGDAGGWDFGFRFFLPIYESTMIGSDLFTAAENGGACPGAGVTFCTTKWTLGPDVHGGETACPAIASGLGCGDVSVRIAQGPNNTIFTAGFSAAAGNVPAVARFTTSPLTSDTSYGTSGVAKLRASGSTQAVELPVALAVSPEGVAFSLNQDTQYPVQRVWP